MNDTIANAYRLMKTGDENNTQPDQSSSNQLNVYELPMIIDAKSDPYTLPVIESFTDHSIDAYTHADTQKAVGMSSDNGIPEVRAIHDIAKKGLTKEHQELVHKIIQGSHNPMETFGHVQNIMGSIDAHKPPVESHRLFTSEEVDRLHEKFPNHTPIRGSVLSAYGHGMDKYHIDSNLGATKISSSDIPKEHRPADDDLYSNYAYHISKHPDKGMIQHYTDDSKAINRFLVLKHQAGGEHPFDEHTVEYHGVPLKTIHDASAKLGKMIDSSEPLDHDVSVYTGVGTSTKPMEVTSGGKSSGTFHSPTFLSTSLSPHIASGFARKKQDGYTDILHFRLPKGTKHGMYLEGNTTNPGEYEYLLKPGLNVKVHPEPKYMMNNNNWHRVWDAEIQK